MRRQIDLHNNHFEVTVLEKSGFERFGKKLLQIEKNAPQFVDLAVNETGEGTIQFGKQSTSIKMAVKGETVFIHAFNRIFSLNIIDPIEHAASKVGGRSGLSRAPMPGTVVDINVVEGDQVKKGEPMMTIESMKMLTVIKAPRDGEVAQVHLESGQTFEKNRVLVTLAEEEEL